MYQLYVSNQAKKDLKRLDKPIIKKVISILEDIAENPFVGEICKNGVLPIKEPSIELLIK